MKTLALILALCLIPSAKTRAEHSVMVRVAWTQWQEAAVSRHATVVYLSDESCAACAVVNRDCLTDPHVVRRLNRLNPLKVTGTQIRLWRVPSIPYLILVDRDWRIVRRDPCPTSPVEMIMVLELYERLVKQ